MPLPDEPSYLQRHRAESFGAVAADYDRYRPSYPDALIDDLVALGGRRVLDIGTGTGKAAVLLAARGLQVLGVEIDPQMAQVARTHGLDVEVGSFETWDDAGRRFDLITSAQAWHWVDPVLAAPKAARLLDAGGSLALFWNYEDIDTETKRLLDEVYERYAPELVSNPDGNARRREDEPYVAELRATGAFDSVTVRRYPWERSTPLDVWIGRLGTHSDHLQLEPPRLAELQAASRAALAARGDEVHTTGGTFTILAR